MNTKYNMLKRIFLFALVCTVATMAQAQCLDGKWKSEQTEKNGKINIYLIFSGSELNLKVTGTMVEPEFGSIILSVSMPSSYVREGNKLSVMPHKEEAKINLDDLEVKGELADSLEAHPEMKEFIKTILVGALDEKKDDLLKEFPLDDVGLEIVSQTESTLSIRDDKGEEMVFTRVKDE